MKKIVLASLISLLVGTLPACSTNLSSSHPHSHRTADSTQTQPGFHNGVFSNQQGTIVIKNVATIVTNDPSTTQKLCAVIFRGTFTNKTASKTQAADFFQKYLEAYPLPKSQHQKLTSSNLVAQSPYDSEIAAAHISTAPHKTTHFAVAFPLKKLYSHYELVPLTTQRQHLQAGVFKAKKTPLTNSAATGTTSTTTAKSSNSSQSTSKNVIHLTIDQKKQINADFLNWAAERATVGHMAVSDWYFDHGSAGLGDWYANTPDGQVQVQNQNQPGAAAFKIHAVGGCIFYKSKDGQIGKQNLYKGSFADNYSIGLDDSQPVSKYLLGDNGVVYELKTGNGSSVSSRTGFGQYDDNGQLGNYQPDQNFEISADQAAQHELQKLLTPYQ